MLGYDIENAIDSLDDVTFYKDWTKNFEDGIDSSAKMVYEFTSSATLEEVQKAIADYRENTGCSCMHDCCGHWFRSSIQVFSNGPHNIYSDRIERTNYLIMSNWARNY